MKRLIFFDVDNTILSSKQRQILPQTRKLLEELASNPDVILGFATGRGPSKVDILGDMEQLFTYRVLVNGAVTMKKDDILYEDYIKVSDVENIVNKTLSSNISIGMVGFSEEAVTFIDQSVIFALKGFQTTRPIIDPRFYEKNHVYQIWLFKENRDEINDILKNFPMFKPYYWHYGGVDLVYPTVNKATAIKRIKSLYKDYQLICVGDGHNDIDMLKLADIGIAMGNTGYEELKEVSTHIAPHIEDDKLYDFFKETKLI